MLRELSILFKQPTSNEMVNAILDGRKTQMRRVISDNWIQSEQLPIPTDEHKLIWHFWCSGEHKSKYQIGDHLYVRETFCYGTLVGDFDELSGQNESWVEQTQNEEDRENILYKSDTSHVDFGDVDLTEVVWKPSIHMPKNTLVYG